MPPPMMQTSHSKVGISVLPSAAAPGARSIRRGRGTCRGRSARGSRDRWRRCCGSRAPSDRWRCGRRRAGPGSRSIFAAAIAASTTSRRSASGRSTKLRPRARAASSSAFSCAPYFAAGDGAGPSQPREPVAVIGFGVGAVVAHPAKKALHRRVAPGGADLVGQHDLGESADARLVRRPERRCLREQAARPRERRGQRSEQLQQRSALHGSNHHLSTDDGHQHASRRECAPPAPDRMSSDSTTRSASLPVSIEPLSRLVEHQARVVDRRELERFFAADALLDAHHAAAQRVARDEVIDRPERRIGDDRSVGARRDQQAGVEIHPHGRRQKRALAAPVLHQARPGEIQMVLRGDGDVELLQPRQMIGAADERVLDRPALARRSERSRSAAS